MQVGRTSRKIEGKNNYTNVLLATISKSTPTSPPGVPCGMGSVACWLRDCITEMECKPNTSVAIAYTINIKLKQIF